MDIPPLEEKKNHYVRLLLRALTVVAVFLLVYLAGDSRRNVSGAIGQVNGEGTEGYVARWVLPIPGSFNTASVVTDCTPSVTIRWSKSLNADYYSVDAAVDANKDGIYNDGAPYTINANIVSPQKINDTNVKRGTGYFYFIKAHNEGAETDIDPSPVYVKVSSCPPTIIEVPPK